MSVVEFAAKRGITAETLAIMHNEKRMTYKQIADTFKCSVGSIFNLFKAFNLPHRKSGFEKGSFHHTEETKGRLREKLSGRVFSKETIRRMSETRKKMYANGWKSGKWNGGKRIRHDGYIQILSPEHPHCSKDGYVMEHRLVMEQILGRYLSEEEIVHHINGVRDDNRPENLFLFASNGEHQRYHALYTRKRNKRGFIS